MSFCPRQTSLTAQIGPSKFKITGRAAGSGVGERGRQDQGGRESAKIRRPADLDHAETVTAKHLAEKADVPTIPGTPDAISDVSEVKLIAKEIGYPLIVKASFGGGGRAEDLFVAWEPVPVASASIGQVHRARLADGREVAVKVQHPGIDRAIESDLSNVSLLENFVGALGPRALNSAAVLEEVKTRFREELDYRLEGERQEQFRRLHAQDPKIHIPAVVRERSARRVLTMELVSGATLEEAALASPETRATSRPWRS